MNQNRFVVPARSPGQAVVKPGEGPRVGDEWLPWTPAFAGVTKIGMESINWPGEYHDRRRYPSRQYRP